MDDGAKLTLASFDPAKPPHKLEWKEETTSIEVRDGHIALEGDEFEVGIQQARQEAAESQLQVFGEDRFSIADRPAARLILVSGSGGTIHRVLTNLGGRDYEIDIEGNYDLARAVLNTMQPSATVPVLTGGAQDLIATAPPPVVPYVNAEVGYSLGLPGDWQIDATGMTSGTNKEVIFSPPEANGSGTIFLSVSLDPRSLQQVIDMYAQSVPDAVREDVIFNGYPGIRYRYSFRDEYYVPLAGKLFLIMTDRPMDSTVQAIMMTIQFQATEQTRNVGMHENGSTIDVTVGTLVTLSLDPGYQWSANTSNEGVLGPEGGMYRAVAPGEATLTATGNPECYTASPPCLAPSVLFTVRVVVH